MVKARGGGARLSTFNPNQPGWFAAMCWQRGARWIRAQGDDWVVAMNSAWYRQIQTGQISAWVGPQWGDALLRGNAPGTKGKWRGAPLPQWTPGENASANWGGSSTAVLQGSRHPREALRFAHWVNTDPKAVDLNISVGYGWPAATGIFRGSALDKPDPFFGGQRYNDVFTASDRAIDTSWKWSPTTDADFAALGDSFGAAMAGDGTLASSLADAQQSTVDNLLAKGLKARSAR